MKRTLLTALLLAIAFAVSSAHSAQASDVFLGKITLRSTDKLDASARKKLAEIAASVKRKRLSGVVKVRGDFPQAASAAEYLSKSVFMAREAEIYLRTLLPKKVQVFVTGSRYSGARREGESSVEIHLYPRQLRAEELESLKTLSSEHDHLPIAPKSETVVEKTLPAETVIEGGLLSAPDDDTDHKSSVRDRATETEHREDPALANELVQKAKARAAEKARRRESGN